VLRRQMSRNFRKPLIVMTPKSLLRHKQAVSRPGDLADGHFRMVLDDSSIEDASGVARLIFCSGKIYYELVNERAEKEREDDVAIVRIEQLHPFPYEDIESVLETYENAEEIAWVQEEPLNAGAYRYIEPIFREELDLEIVYIGRDASATPAVGSSKMHHEEQAEILAQAMAPFEDEEGDETDEESGSPEASEEAKDRVTVSK